LFLRFCAVNLCVYVRKHKNSHLDYKNNKYLQILAKIPNIVTVITLCKI
jgi:hypothetical protein